MISPTKYPWFILDAAVFVFVNGVVLWFLRDRAAGGVEVSFLRLLILGLAVFRAADIIANEKVAKPIRAPFVELEEKKGKEVEVPKAYGFMGAMGDLIYCPSCVGLWVSMVLVYFYIFSPRVTSVIVLILAISGLERIFTTGVNYLKKKTVN